MLRLMVFTVNILIAASVTGQGNLPLSLVVSTFSSGTKGIQSERLWAGNKKTCFSHLKYRNRRKMRNGLILQRMGTLSLFSIPFSVLFSKFYNFSLICNFGRKQQPGPRRDPF